MASENTLRQRKSAKHAGTSPTAASPSSSVDKPKFVRGWTRLIIRGLLLAGSAALLLREGRSYILSHPELLGQTKGFEKPIPVPKPHFPAASEVYLGPDYAKQKAIKDAFIHSWSAYERDAFGADDYHPISKTGTNISETTGGIGYTIVDALDSLLVFGMDEEYERARDWVENHLTFDRDDNFNTFEITIRLLGGLLAAYHLSSINSSPDLMILSKAVDLADRLLPVFDTPTGLPLSLVNLGQKIGVPDKDNRGMVMEVLNSQPTMDGLFPIFLSPDTGRFFVSDIRLGSRGDSYYEYLLKQWLQTGGTEPIYRKMYDEAMTAIKNKLIYTTIANRLVYTAEISPTRQVPGVEQGWRMNPKQDHLVCFLGGSLLLGVTEGRSSVPPNPASFSRADIEDWQAGTGILKTCVETYTGTKTGLAPEIAFFYTPEHPNAKSQDWYIKQKTGHTPLIDARNILRPETVESLFLAFRLTGDVKYREQGWEIFQAFEKHCKVPTGGYASILDVNQVPVELEDRMETFWLSETLKYLYLLFSDVDDIPLSENVFNTEAHILPIFTPSFKTPFGQKA